MAADNAITASSGDDGMASEEKETASVDNGMASEEKVTASGDNKMAPEEETISGDSEMITGEKEMAAEDNGMASGDNKMAPEEETISGDSEMITGEKEMAAEDNGMASGDNGMTENKAKSKKMMNEILDWFLHIAAAVVVGVLFVTFVAQRTIVYDISMEPTLTAGDNLLVEKLGPRFGWLDRGDIIVIKFPGEKKLLIKRLIAVEGDRVEVIDGKLYVNGELALIGLPEEPETPQGDLPEYTDLTVPEGMVYILGDNRLNSLDSTDFGPIEKKRIMGRAIFRFLPFNRFGTLN